MRALVTGGAGFIGSNLVHHLLINGEEVTVYDNLSRKGSQRNLAWLRNAHGETFRMVEGDIRDAQRVNEVVKDVDIVYHLGAQVAVTASLSNPREDFEVNALGTLNLLEAARRSRAAPIFIFTSTNKVYGALAKAKIIEGETRYTFQDLQQGISESQPLDFHSPYGCSKGAADQYVRDYSRIYGLRTVVFRMSCVYGQRQFGNEDQGWLAHFLISSFLQRPITVYGNGKQVRDVLYIDDLLAAFDRAASRIEVTCGQVYNIGGGPENTISVWAEFKEIVARLLGRSVQALFDDWRPGDQPVYISDITKARRELDWAPQVPVQDGSQRLFDWITKNRELFEALE